MAAEVTVWDRAEFVSKTVEVALEPGGPLHVAVSDLVSMVAGVAMDAAGVPDGDDRGADWPMDHNYVQDLVVDVLREASFQAMREYLEPEAVPA